MAEELDELLDFLSSPSPNLRKAAVEIVEGLTGTDDGSDKLMTRISILLRALSSLLSEDQVVAKPAAASLVNLSQNEEVADTLTETGAVPKIMELLGNRGQAIDRLLIMLLVNLTNLEQGARDLLQENDEKLRGLHVSRLIRLFSRASEEGEDVYEHVAAILVNVTRIDTGRKLLLESKRGLLKIVLHQFDSKSLVRKRGVIGTLRNCCFDAQNELATLLSLSDLVWPCLLLPVAGKQIYSEDDRSKMPPELAVPLSIERQMEDDPQIRMEALDAIYLLAMQEAGLRAFWAVNGPNVLKAGYEDEEDPQIVDKYEQLGSLVIAQSGNGDFKS